MEKDDLALLKYSIIAPYVNKTTDCKSIRSFCKYSSSKQYYYKGELLTFSEETLRKWVRSYNRNGYEELKRKTRFDNNKPRVFDEDTLCRIDDLKTKFPKLRSTTLYKLLVKEGYIEEGQISKRTFQRFVRNRNYLDLNNDHERKSFEFEHPNDLWQTDTTHGPYIVIKGVKYKTYIIAFIDDHSRLIVGAKAFFHDNAVNMQLLLKESIRVYGLPKILYMDNGGPYSNKQLSIICARLGIENRNAKIYDPESKGKVERFNRTLKDTWMNAFDWNDIKSLDDLNNRLEETVKDYNNTIHSSLKDTPNNVYHKDLEDIRRYDNDLDKAFYHTVKRKVNKTGLVSIDNNLYEVDYSLNRKTIDFTYDPFDLSIIYHDGKAYKQVDKQANSRKKRKKNVDYSKIVNKENEEIKEYEGE